MVPQKVHVDNLEDADDAEDAEHLGGPHNAAIATAPLRLRAAGLHHGAGSYEGKTGVVEWGMTVELIADVGEMEWMYEPVTVWIKVGKREREGEGEGKGEET